MTGNEIYKLKELNKHNSKLNSNRKVLDSKATQDEGNDEGDDYDKEKDAGEQFVGNHSKKNYNKN